MFEEIFATQPCLRFECENQPSCLRCHPPELLLLGGKQLLLNQVNLLGWEICDGLCDTCDGYVMPGSLASDTCDGCDAIFRHIYPSRPITTRHNPSLVSQLPRSPVMAVTVLVVRVASAAEPVTPVMV